MCGSATQAYMMHSSQRSLQLTRGMRHQADRFQVQDAPLAFSDTPLSSLAETVQVCGGHECARRWQE